MLDFATARHNMVESQIRTNDVTDRAILDAVATTPRERFVPAALRSIAYRDEDMPIHTSEEGVTRYIMEPRVFARLIQLAEIGRSDLVLYVGAGLGYGPAVLSRVAEMVVALESEPALADAASQNLTEIGIDNVAVVQGEFAKGCPEQAPFDAIVVEGALPEEPTALFDQLKDGGHLVCVVGTGLSGKAKVYERIAGVTSGLTAFDAAVAPLPGFEKPKGFVF